jgi:hypothetical protein
MQPRVADTILSGRRAPHHPRVDRFLHLAIVLLVVLLVASLKKAAKATVCANYLRLHPGRQGFEPAT